MATKYISDLSSVSTLADADVFVIDDGEHNYKIPWSALKALLKTVAQFTVDNAAGTITITTADGGVFTVTPHDPTKQDVLTFDDTPTAGSNNPVKSSGIKSALDLKLNSADYKLFTAPSGETPGTSGIVPAPAASGKYLSSDGAWETPDAAPTAGSNKLITSDAVKQALDNIEIDVDDAMSDSSTNPVQNKVVSAAMKSTSQAKKAYHLGLYLDADGDLCYDYD